MSRYLIVVLAIVAQACNHHSETASESHAYLTFGSEIEASDAQDFTTFMSDFSGDSTQVKLSGTINAVCQEKGCWLTISDHDRELRVTFKDYGFFVPKDAAGKPVIVEGVLKRSVVDVATLKHYAEDEGKSQEEIDAITEAQATYSFVADGVLIEDSSTER